MLHILQYKPFLVKQSSIKKESITLSVCSAQEIRYSVVYMTPLVAQGTCRKIAICVSYRQILIKQEALGT